MSDSAERKRNHFDPFKSKAAHAQEARELRGRIDQLRAQGLTWKQINRRFSWCDGRAEGIVERTTAGRTGIDSFHERGQDAQKR